MRIVSGTHKGRRFKPGKNFKARPTTDFAKENLFNVLSNFLNFRGLEILDLFGGTGGISYEFASREAKSVTCIELNYKHFSFVKKTASEFGFNQIQPIKTDVFSFVKSCKQKFDLIFADPPFDMKNINELPQLIFENQLLNTHGIFLLEHGRNHDFSTHPNFTEKRIYGSVNFSFFAHCKN